MDVVPAAARMPQHCTNLELHRVTVAPAINRQARRGGEKTWLCAKSAEALMEAVGLVTECRHCD